MRKHILRLGHDSLIYGLGSVGRRLAGIITLPLYARAFGPKEFANLELAVATYSLLGGVVDLGLTSAFVRSFFDYGKDREGIRGRRLVVSTSFSVIFGSSFFLATALVVFRDFAARVIFVHPGEAEIQLVVLVAAMIPLGEAAILTAQLMRVCNERRSFVISTVVGSVITLAVGPVLVFGLHTGVQGVLVGQLAGFIASAAYGAVIARRWLRLRFSRTRLAEMLRYGLPFLPTAAAFWALALLDRFMIARLSGLGQLGEYAVANRVTAPIPLILFGFATAYSPFILQLWKENREMELAVRGRTLTYVTVVIACVAVALSLFAREIIAVVAPSYHTAYKAVGLLLLGIGSYGLCSVIAAGMSITRKTYWNMLFSGIGAGVNLGLNFLLIPAYGMIGAAAATAVGYGVITLLYYANAQRIYRTPYEPSKILATVALAIPAGALGLVAYPNIAVALLVKGAVLLAFPAALVAVGIIPLQRLRAAVTG
ncbi:MAG TPA: oligosaccharide flippase family protein [Solirubrobacteraceae bacterium]